MLKNMKMECDFYHTDVVNGKVTCDNDHFALDFDDYDKTAGPITFSNTSIEQIEDTIPKMIEIREAICKVITDLQEEKCRRLCADTPFAINTAWETDRMWFLIVSEPAADIFGHNRYEPKVEIISVDKDAMESDEVCYTNWVSLSVLENDPTVKEITNEEFFIYVNRKFAETIPGYSNFICCFVDSEDIMCGQMYTGCGDLDSSEGCESTTMFYTDCVGEPDAENIFKEKVKYKLSQLKEWLAKN